MSAEYILVVFYIHRLYHVLLKHDSKGEYEQTTKI